MADARGCHAGSPARLPRRICRTSGMFWGLDKGLMRAAKAVERAAAEGFVRVS